VDPGRSAVRLGGYTLIRRHDLDDVDRFNFADDPAEPHHLADARPEKVAERSPLLDDWLKTLDTVKSRSK
jgi:hypothetical protein